MQRHILEAALCHETESMQRVALALTKLTQDLKVNTVIAEFDFVEIRHDSAKFKQA